MHLHLKLQTTWVVKWFDIEPNHLNYYQPENQKVCRKFMECCRRCHLEERVRVEDVCTMHLFVVLSVGVTLFGMSTSFVSYQRALRSTLDDKEDLTIIASIVLFIYRSFTNFSRVSSGVKIFRGQI